MNILLYDFSCQYTYALLNSLTHLRSSENLYATGFSYTKDEASHPEITRLSSFSSLLLASKDSLFSELGIIHLSLALNISISKYQGKLILQDLLDEATLKTFSDLHYRHFNFNTNKLFSYLYTLCSFLDHYASQACLVIHRDTIQNAPGLMLYLLSKKYGCKFVDSPNTAYINKGYLRVNLNPVTQTDIECSLHLGFDSDNVYSKLINLSPPGLFKKSKEKFFGLTLASSDSFSIHLYRFAIIVNVVQYSCLHSLHYLIILARFIKVLFLETKSAFSLVFTHKLKTRFFDAIFHHKKLLSYWAYQYFCFLDADRLLDLYTTSCFSLILLNLQPERTTSPNTQWFNNVNFFFELITSVNHPIGDMFPYVIREHPANYILNSRHIIRSYLYRSPSFYIKLHRAGAIFSDTLFHLSNFALRSKKIIIWSSSFALEYQSLVDKKPNKSFPNIFQICNEWYSDIVDTTTIFNDHSSKLCASVLKTDHYGPGHSSLRESLYFLSKKYIWIDVTPESIKNDLYNSSFNLATITNLLLDSEF